MTAEEHAHVQSLEATVKRYRRRIVELKETHRLAFYAAWSAHLNGGRDPDIAWHDYKLTLEPDVSSRAFSSKHP